MWWFALRVRRSLSQAPEMAAGTGDSEIRECVAADVDETPSGIREMLRRLLILAG